MIKIFIASLILINCAFSNEPIPKKRCVAWRAGEAGGEIAGRGFRHRDRRDASPPEDRRAVGHRLSARAGGG